jgi:hypothetical protein
LKISSSVSNPSASAKGSTFFLSYWNLFTAR